MRACSDLLRTHGQIRTMIVFGTRPEAIKIAPVARAMQRDPQHTPILVSTGQHREMLDQMWPVLDIHPDIDLALMRDRQTLSDLTARLVAALGDVVAAERPDVVLVQGDTTTAMAGALAAFYARTPVAHVEAGLRSGRLDNPFPEELNRKLISTMAQWNFAPTALAAKNLLDEGVAPASIAVTGNTGIDNLLWVLRDKRVSSPFTSDRRKILVTLHRRENQGDTMRGLAGALLALADRGDVELVLPLHKSPAVREALLPILSGHPCIQIVEPLDYLTFTSTLADCDLVLTDSGGVQEEAPTLGKPVLVLRETTERPEAVAAGTSRLIGTSPEVVLRESARLLDDGAAYRAMTRQSNPFGDGSATPRILDRLHADLRVEPVLSLAG